MPKDKIKTRKKIIEALGRLLTRTGVEDLGINSVAFEAGIDKVLIYRYFGDFDGLLQAYAEDTDLWPSTSELLGHEPDHRRSLDLKDILARYLHNQLKEMRRRKTIQEVMRWELLKQNALTNSLNDHREKQMQELLNKLSITHEPDQENDLEALLALLDAGLTYMVLRSKTSEKYLGIDLHSNFGWKRLENIITAIIDSYLEAPGKAKA
jgi:AcrR family transcriptional regulator